MPKHSRNQYQDPTNPVRNVTAEQVRECEALLETKAGNTPPYWGIAEFNDQFGHPGYSVNIPKNTEPPPESGTRDMQEITRLMSKGFTDQHGHSMQGAPVGVAFSLDKGETWQLVGEYLEAQKTTAEE